MIKSKLQADQITAMKAHDQKKLTTIRYILAAIQKKEIDTQKELTDEEVIAVLQKVNKEYKESIDAFTKGNRQDLLVEAEEQMQLVTSYLPAQISDEEIDTKVQALMQEYVSQRAANPKAFIGIAMKALRGTADPARIMAALKKAGAV